MLFVSELNRAKNTHFCFIFPSLPLFPFYFPSFVTEPICLIHFLYVFHENFSKNTRNRATLGLGQKPVFNHRDLIGKILSNTFNLFIQWCTIKVHYMVYMNIEQAPFSDSASFIFAVPAPICPSKVGTGAKQL